MNRCVTRINIFYVLNVESM